MQERLLAGAARTLVLSFAILVAQAAPAIENSYAFKTNLVHRTLTNLVEVTMPVTRFVNTFQTNFVDTYVTNQVMVFLTNRVVETVTNRHTIEQVRTNFVQLTLTNIKTLSLTNWNTVLVFRTNYVSQQVTNVVDIDAPAIVPSRAAAATNQSPLVPKNVATVMANDRIKVEAQKTGRRLANRQVEVHLSAESLPPGTAPLRVQQWRVESLDGSFLACAQEQEFKRELAIGQYKLEVKALAGAENLPLAAKGTLAVTPDDVTLQIKPLPKL